MLYQYGFNLLTENVANYFYANIFSNSISDVTANITTVFIANIFAFSLHSGSKSSNISLPINTSKLKVWQSYPQILRQIFCNISQGKFHFRNILKTIFFQWILLNGFVGGNYISAEQLIANQYFTNSFCVFFIYLFIFSWCTICCLFISHFHESFRRSCQKHRFLWPIIARHQVKSWHRVWPN